MRCSATTFIYKFKKLTNCDTRKRNVQLISIGFILERHARFRSYKL